jgi:Domain of unknown function (DUF4190)
MSADQPPNPFSREGSSPEDQRGSSSSSHPDASGPGSTPNSDSSTDGESPWPTYQPRPEPTLPLSGDPYGPSSSARTADDDSPQGSPYGAYGAVADSPYNSPPPYSSMPPYGSEQPYGSSYGDSPYAVNPYSPSFGSATPYQPDYGTSSSYGAPAVQHPQAIVAMVLGILGLAVCPLIGIAGLVLGNKARKEIDASAGMLAGRGMATAGFVLGIISIAFTLLVILVIVLGVAGAFGT